MTDMRDFELLDERGPWMRCAKCGAPVVDSDTVLNLADAIEAANQHTCEAS